MVVCNLNLLNFIVGEENISFQMFCSLLSLLLSKQIIKIISAGIFKLLRRPGIDSKE